MEKNSKFDPATKHSYSNTNYIILGLVAEKATGKDIDKLFDEYIFRPLNLENTFFVPYHVPRQDLLMGMYIILPYRLMNGTQLNPKIHRGQRWGFLQVRW